MSEDGTRKTRVVIYGSCVSRDTFEFLDPAQFQLDRYIARQSLISAYSVPTPVDESDLKSLASDFQRRTIRDDFAGSLHGDLQIYGPDADVLLWDLTDERYGVWDLGGGRFVTRSIELIMSGMDASLKRRGRLVPYGSPRHLRLWKRALSSFARSLHEAEFSTPPILIAPLWARQDQHGAPLGITHGPKLRTANRILHRYLRQTGSIPRVTTQAAKTTASSTHRWGAAPYHYTDEIYSELSERLAEAILNSSDGRQNTQNNE